MISPVDLLKELVRIPSPSGGEEKVVDFLENMLCGLGWEPVRTGRNLHVFLGDSGPLLLLNSHTDTVPAGEGWSMPPHEGRVQDGKIYGRGANDAKGCLCAMIVGAARAFASNPPPGRLCLAFTCEEETSGEGLEKLINILPRPDAAVVGEPTGLAPAVAQKGLLLLEVTAKGRSAHAAWGGGSNAVTAAAKDILALSDFRFEREHPTLGFPSLTVTQTRGGERHNMVPDRCKVTVDIRTTPAYTPEEIVRMVENRVAGEVSVRSERLHAVDTDPTQPIVQAARRANPNGAPFGSPTLSDWVFLKDIPTIKVGPGSSRRSHTPDEYVETAEIEDGAVFYKKLIREYFKRP
ncbi:MAG: M20/M25/M40 family metallo-hydrolase [Elusimicrobiota bacterium]